MKRLALSVEGIVQGVGFRPFVHGLARRFGLSGSVWNDAEGVKIELQGSDEALGRFVSALADEAPPLAVIASVAQREIATRSEHGFHIDASREASGPRVTPVSPDMATCDDCLRELFDPQDRRHRYPFINCTNCGPRYTIVVDVPYDRPRTTMASFAMCAACAEEYRDPRDRRYHAQPIACAACGPRLWLCDAGGVTLPGDPLAEVTALLRRGGIVALKGLGGFHLACDARNEAAVAALRRRKHREEKPFAVMVADLEAARRLCAPSEAEARLLSGIRRPIVLVPRKDGGPLAASVAPHNRDVGMMLPYTPLHHLLCRDFGGPLVMTSGNLSDEPIAYLDAEAQRRLSRIADAFLLHDRPIHVRTDDSVFRVWPSARGDAPMALRRARGYAPQPIALPAASPFPLLACGAELKNTICAAKGRYAYVSHHIGDLENLAAYASFEQAVDHLTRLFDVVPRVIAHDLHPEYLSTKWAQEQPELRLCGVQHHHAHIAACLADNGEHGPAIGVAYDGLGYGSDGTLWGGEILRADTRGFERLGHWSRCAMPGGAAAIRQPWRMAAAHLEEAFGGEAPPLPIRDRHAEAWPVMVALARSGSMAPLTSSLGRLFDAVAALAGIRDTVCYEGQAAIELEQRALPGESGSYPVALSECDDGFVLACGDVVRAVVDDLRRGIDAAVVAARFHNAVADATALACRAARARTGLTLVALSGGVFQNLRLLRSTVDRLTRDGFRVLCHRQLPPNDGCISFGQAVIAAASADPR